MKAIQKLIGNAVEAKYKNQPVLLRVQAIVQSRVLFQAMPIVDGLVDGDVDEVRLLSVADFEEDVLPTVQAVQFV